MGAIVAPVQLERIRGLVQQRRGRRRDDVAAVVGVSDGRLLLSADAVHRRPAVVHDRAGRDLRPGARDDDVPHARGVGRAREQHAVRPRGERVDREHQPRARHRAEDQGGRRVDQLDESVRRVERVRRLSRERVRTRGRARGDVGVREAREDAGRRTRRAVRVRTTRLPTQRAPNGAAELARRSRRSIARPSCSSAGSRRVRTRATSAASSRPTARTLGEVGEGNRKDIRNAVEAAHAAWKGWGKATGHLRGQILYYIAENLAARADEFARRIDEQTACGDAMRRRAKSTPPSRGSSPTRRGPTSTTARCTTCRSAASRSR